MVESFTVLGTSARMCNLNVLFLLDKNLYSGDPNLKLSIKKTQNSSEKFWEYNFNSLILPNPPITKDTEVSRSFDNILLSPGTYVIMAEGTLFKQLRSININVNSLEYPDEFLEKNPIGIGGGIRINKIDLLDVDNRYISGKEYRYVLGNPTGSGVPIGETSGKLMFYPRYRRDSKTIGSNGLRGGGYSVGYSTVHIIDYNKLGSQIGRTVYEYINIPDKVINYSWIDKSISYDSAIKSKDENPSGLDGYKHSENGTLLKESKMLLKNNRYQEQEVIEYKYLGLGGGPYIVWGVRKTQPDTWWTNSNSFIPCINDYNLNVLRNALTIEAYNSYAHSTIAWAYLYPAIRPMQYKLKERIHKLYEENGVVETITNYDYNLKDQLIKETLKSNSKELRSIDYKYPPDINSNSIINKLTEANRINVPVETKQTINGQISQTINEYALFNNIPQLSIVKTNTGADRAVEARIRYHQYDVYGNPIQVSMDGGMNVVYLWSYNGQYPIAEIKNTTYADVVSVLGQSLIDRVTSSSVPSDADMLVVNSLRNNTTTLKDILITTYTYKPQVGITSATDSSGKTIYYSYDKFDRLKESYIDDAGKKIIQAYDYFYSK
ncbi:hypothetical protein FACS1894169_15300 [Bacteroidia bacterium]|nr:hypothetical protein FACS1894169_15300 [Bacteroidia bacterium]